MKRCFFILLLIVNAVALTVPDIFYGPVLSNLKVKDIANNNSKLTLLLNEFPESKIYQIRCLVQNPKSSTCGRHAIKNLIFTMNAFSQSNINQFKSQLSKIFDLKLFNTFNETLCKYLKVKNNQDYIYTTQVTKAFEGIASYQYKYAKQIFSNNIDLSAICFFPIWLTAEQLRKEHPSYFNNNFKKKFPQFSIIDNMYPNYLILQAVYKFRQSTGRILGFVIVVEEDDCDPHAISLIIRKVKNSFEYFILDSTNCEEAYWLNDIKKIKNLFEMPLNKLNNLVSLATKH